MGPWEKTSTKLRLTSSVTAATTILPQPHFPTNLGLDLTFHDWTTRSGSHVRSLVVWLCESPLDPEPSRPVPLSHTSLTHDTAQAPASIFDRLNCRYAHPRFPERTVVLFWGNVSVVILPLPLPLRPATMPHVSRSRNEGFTPSMVTKWGQRPPVKPTYSFTSGRCSFQNWDHCLQTVLTPHAPPSHPSLMQRLPVTQPRFEPPQKMRGATSSPFDVQPAVVSVPSRSSIFSDAVSNH